MTRAAVRHTDLSVEAAPAVGMTIAVHARQAPGHPAIRSPYGDRSFQQLNARANQLARALGARGVRAGDAIALLCGNRPEFMETYFAAWRSGLRITPINWHLTAEETAYIAADCEARALVADARFAQVSERVAESLPRLVTRLAVGGSLHRFEPYDGALDAEIPDDLDDPVLGLAMMYTSGTTGRPKGVLRKPSPNPSQALTTVLPLAGYVPYRDMHLCTGPLYHAAPLGFSAVQPLAVGVGVVMMDRFDAHAALRLIAEHRITHTHMVPTMFHRLLALAPSVRHHFDLSSLRFIVHGAAPTPAAMKHALIAWLGPILVEYYSATEGFGATITSEEWLAKPGSVGRPPEGQVKIRGEGFAPVPVGEPGTIYLRATDAARFEYFRDADKTAGAYHGDYFTLGDVGYLDPDGYLFLCDRSADVIISGGVNVYPAEVDAVLLQHPAVGDAATIGVPDPEWGEQVKVVVELAAGAQPSDDLAAELVAFCRARLAAFKCPRNVEFTDRLPRYDTGKIYRRRLRERYWQGRERKI
jgi:long-chain acyl-CoA synthetase